MSLLSIPNNFTAYTKIQSSLVNANFTAIASLINGALDNSNIAAAAGIAYSKLTLTGSVVNSDISATAAIAYSKLALTGGVVNSDINAAAAIAYSKLALSNSVVNSDISATAAIAWSKMAALGNTQVVTTTSGGVLQSLASLPVSLGGTGQTSFAAGVLKSNGTTISSSSIVDSDISATAAIALTKLAQGGAALTQSLVWNGTAWTPGSAGAGVGAKNYIANYNFETNSVANWSLANTAISTANGYPVPTSTAAAGTPLDSTHGATAAAITLSFTPVSTGKLAGTYSGSLASSGATTAGDTLLSSPCTIDIEDQAKMLAFKFAYKLSVDPGATNRNFSGTSLNTWAVWIYDVTNAAWIQPQGVYNLTQSSGVGIASGTFQTPSNMTQFQLALVNINAAGAAVTLLLDDFSVGPSVSVYGPAMTDWQSYTPTFNGFGTPTNVAFNWRRVGDSIEIEGSCTAGTPTAVPARISLPSGLTLNTSKLSSLGSAVGVAATANTVTSGALNMTYVFVANGQTTNLSLNAPANGSVVNTLVEANASALYASGNSMSLRAVVPISGFSSNSQMSSDTDTRVCAARATTPTGTPPSTVTTVTWTLAARDTHAAFGVPNFTSYAVPVSGYYRVYVQYLFGGTFALNTINSAVILKTGSTIAQNVVYSGGAVTQQPISAATVEYFNAGDTISVQSQCTATSPTYAGGANYNFWTVERLTGPASIASTESLVCRYTSSTTTLTAAADTLISFANKSIDTHGAFSSNTTFTAPISGTYDVMAKLQMNSNTLSTAQSFRVSLYKNGSPYSQPMGLIAGNGSAQTYFVWGTDAVKLNAGDTLTINGFCSISVGLASGDNLCTVLISRRGN